MAEAIRNHWQVEVNNNSRDTSYGEDKLKSFNIDIQRSTSSILTFVMNGLKRMKQEQSLIELREDLVHSKDKAYSFFQKEIL